MKNCIYIFLLLIFPISLSAQTGTIYGKVLDKSTGEALIGASVVISSLKKSTIVDLDGNFKLDVPPGTYTIQVSYISYNNYISKDIVVKKGEEVHTNLLLEPSDIQLEGVKIEDKANIESMTALVIEQKNAPVLFDGISSEQIKKTPDRNTADVLKRVSGATIQDNQFVVIRGLPDRYNSAFINGTPLPSSEPDRKAFAFDIFPSSLLNDLKIIKTALPSLSGEFAGGLILVKTKDIPEKNYYQITIGASFNTITTFKDFTKSKGGSLDFLGIDDGTRQLPESFPGNKEFNAFQSPFLLKDSLAAIAQMLPNNFPLQKFAAPPGLNFQFSMGHNANLLPKDMREKATKKVEFGSVFALTYNNNYQVRESQRNDYNNIEKTIAYFDTQYNINTNWGALWNIALLHSNNKGANNKISIKNLFNVNTNDQYTFREGAELALGFDVLSHNYLYTQNMLLSSQVNGEHVLPKSRIRFDWGGGYNRLERIVPDYKIIEYKRSLGDTNAIYSVPFQNTVNRNYGGRFFSTQLDNIYSGNFDVSIPFKIKSTRHELKAGTYLQYKNRGFEGRQLGYARYSSSGFNSAISTYGVDSIFDRENFGTQGLIVREVTKKSDSYIYENNLAAAYLQLEHAFWENKLRFIYGARMENFRQMLETYQIGSDSIPFILDTTVTDILPSLNIVYGFVKNMNLRFAFSQTVTRPEARELAPFAFYDYSLFAIVQGSDKLQRTKITNLDLRYEWYPSGGQVISLTAFYKNFENAIEKILVPSQSDGRKLSYINVPSAYSYGFEFEFRFTIASFLKNAKSQFLKDLSFSGNIAIIQSEVNLDSVVGVSEKRPMQGQSPYIVNGTVSYLHSKYHFGINVAMNYIGRRIFSVGDVTYASIWENPRAVLDVQLSKMFWNKRIELKLNFRDLLAQDFINYQDMNNNGKYDEAADYTMLRQHVGQQISFSASMKF